MSKKQQSERLFTAFGDINDRYVDEALEKTEHRPVLRRVIALAACFAIIVSLSLYLFIPINDAPDLSKYNGSEYYQVISAIENLYYRPHGNKNNFDRLVASLGGFLSKKDAMANPESDVPIYEGGVAPGDTGSGTNGYFEVTDNQVAGVIEADLIKASDSHLYRLSAVYRSLSLKIYAIKDGTESTDPIATLPIETPDGAQIITVTSAEMYLSDDLTTVTVITSCECKSNRWMTAIYSIDVTDPTAPTVTSTVTLSGQYNTSRKIGDRIIVITSYYVKRGIDYDNPETFIPTVNSGEGSETVPMSDIVMPSVVGDVNYGVVVLIEEGAAKPTDTLALFNFAGKVYATENGIFATHSYTENLLVSQERDYTSYLPATMTEIAHITVDDGLALGGKMTVEGSVKDQYSMDEKDGFLRLVTTTNAREINGRPTRITNASLYVFDLSDYSERRSIKYFAPNGEEAMSVRFDGDELYVCTAEVVTMTDPVYFFDLSDYDNITSTDTGTIDGYSTSLIQLGGGYLLGIGIDAQRNVKLEIYEKGTGGVLSTDCIIIGGDYS
ncbi:MAG: beta-propeller domain-containing protein, partial [Clostridia bacterium]|nr:beta-propeller domain-containing protein [Clostridia bacterium]